MKKRIILKISIFALILILIFVGILHYSDNIKQLSLIKNIKHANERNNQEEITTIDVTEIELGKETRA